MGSTKGRSAGGVGVLGSVRIKKKIEKENYSSRSLHPPKVLQC